MFTLGVAANGPELARFAEAPCRSSVNAELRAASLFLCEGVGLVVSYVISSTEEPQNWGTDPDVIARELVARLGASTQQLADTDVYAYDFAFDDTLGHIDRDGNALVVEGSQLHAASQLAIFFRDLMREEPPGGLFLYDEGYEKSARVTAEMTAADVERAYINASEGTVALVDVEET